MALQRQMNTIAKTGETCNPLLLKVRKKKKEAVLSYLKIQRQKENGAFSCITFPTVQEPLADELSYVMEKR